MSLILNLKNFFAITKYLQSYLDFSTLRKIHFVDQDVVVMYTLYLITPAHL